MTLPFIFILVGLNDYNSSDILGVYRSREKAERHMARLQRLKEKREKSLAASEWMDDGLTEVQRCTSGLYCDSFMIEEHRLK